VTSIPATLSTPRCLRGQGSAMASVGANIRVNRTTRKLRLRVPSSLRSSVAGYAVR